jgi:hypothetical protein
MPVILSMAYDIFSGTHFVIHVSTFSRNTSMFNTIIFTELSLRTYYATRVHYRLGTEKQWNIRW